MWLTIYFGTMVSSVAVFFVMLLVSYLHVKSNKDVLAGLKESIFSPGFMVYGTVVSLLPVVNLFFILRNIKGTLEFKREISV